MKFKQWDGFNPLGEWTKEIDVRSFIQANYTPYEGDDSFLALPTEKTKKLWNEVLKLYEEERKKGVLDVDTKTPSAIDAYEAGYIDKDLEEVTAKRDANKTEMRKVEDDDTLENDLFDLIDSMYDNREEGDI